MRKRRESIAAGKKAAVVKNAEAQAKEMLAQQVIAVDDGGDKEAQGGNKENDQRFKTMEDKVRMQEAEMAQLRAEMTEMRGFSLKKGNRILIYDGGQKS